MRYAFVEYLKNPALIVRVGPDTTKKKSKYEKSVTGEIFGDRVILKGYDQGVEPTLFTAAMIVLYEEGFRFVEIERLGPPHRTLILALGPEGVIGMKTHIHSVKHAHNPDGSLNPNIVAEHAKAAEAAYVSGKEKLLGLYENVLHDGSVITSFHHVAADGVGSQQQ